MTVKTNTAKRVYSDRKLCMVDRSPEGPYNGTPTERHTHVEHGAGLKEFTKKVGLTAHEGRQKIVAIGNGKTNRTAEGPGTRERTTRKAIASNMT
jgi:hypothetical protein